MYWEAVLKEVLNKEDPKKECTLTNVKETNKRNVMVVKEPRDVSFNPIKRFKKYYLGEKYPDIYLTEREAQTVFHYMQGKSTGDVAMILNLSSRTIEFYVKNMKFKLNCRFKSELMMKLLSSDFMHQYNLDPVENE